MANKPIHMKQLKSVLRHYFQGHGIKTIVRSHNLSRNTVRKYIRLLSDLNLTWDEVDTMEEKDLMDLFLRKEKEPESKPRMKTLEKFFPYMQRELRKVGVTRKTLWGEYINKHLDGYRFTQFCEHYRRLAGRTNPTMHIEYKAGDKLLVYYAGKKLSVTDPDTGESTDVEVFVSILGASQLIYVEASESQQKADFIGSVERSLHYYAGVPKAIVTDNLKSAVTKSNRYEPVLNEDFADFADHYQTAVIPTRAYRPKDKALVEGAVKIVYQQIYAHLRKQIFFSLAELNKAIREKLEELNNRKLTDRQASRRDFFHEVEKKVLSPLPEKHFELRSYAYATVLQNGHVRLAEDKHYYSVPYRYIRKKVKIAYNSSEVIIYYNYTTVEDHMASNHGSYTKWNAAFFIQWAESIDPCVNLLITQILEKKQHPEQAYKSCMGVLRLEKKVGKERFVKACSLALDYERYNYKTVQSILEKGLDRVDTSPERPVMPKHHNIRGKDYYQNNNHNKS